MKNNLLILSFEPFNKESTNGKTLWSMVEALQDDFKISQIFIKNLTPNVQGKYRSLLINERNIVKPFISVKKILKPIEPNLLVYNTKENFNNLKKSKKSALTMIIRNILWHFMFIKFKYVFKWIEEEKPDYIFIFDSDLPFINFLARKIKKKYNCDIIFYTTENYSLKEKNYMNGKYDRKPIYRLFKHTLFKSYKKLFKHTKNEIFLTHSLLEEYSQHYQLNSASVIYPSSKIQLLPKKDDGELTIFSYCGSLGVGRWETLIKFLKIVKNFNNIKVIIASNLSEEKKQELSKYPEVDYRGYVSFEEVLNIYKESDILLHFESFDESIAEDCKHAFSGKIADCISSGRPFLYFGPAHNAVSSFIAKNKCALQSNNTEQLNEMINEIVTNSKYKYIYYENAKNTAKLFFNSEKNLELLIKVISTF